jgi:hypothetical protein
MNLGHREYQQGDDLVNFTLLHPQNTHRALPACAMVCAAHVDLFFD